MSGREELELALKLAAQATPHPWEPEVVNDITAIVNRADISEDWDIGQIYNNANADFTIAAVNWLRAHGPAMLARVAELEAEVLRLQAQLGCADHDARHMVD